MNNAYRANNPIYFAIIPAINNVTHPKWVLKKC